MVNNIYFNLKMFKKRKNSKPLIRNLNFGDFGIFCKNEGSLELINITQMKKKLKFFIRKKKSELDIIREKIWYFARPNFFIQKKSKNSRMGKGKGMIERKIIRLKKNFIIFEFKGIKISKIIKFIKFINKITKIKFNILKKYNSFFCLWSKKNKYLIYHDKYLFF